MAVVESYKVPHFPVGRELGYNNPCVIAHNRTLWEIVRLLPRDADELLNCWGISPTRLKQHGDQMLMALGPFRAELERDRDVYQPSTEDPKGDGRPHPQWVVTREHENLPEGIFQH